MYFLLHVELGVDLMCVEGVNFETRKADLAHISKKLDRKLRLKHVLVADGHLGKERRGRLEFGARRCYYLK